MSRAKRGIWVSAAAAMPMVQPRTRIPRFVRDDKCVLANANI
jgi:hypothetical protein